ncbi:MAG: hypothetical protein IKI65_04595, partial [Firmicutes bacterium]|nr:hypothetical protein [Bacillota bacterium]
MRAESPDDITLSYQISNRKTFSFIKPKDFEWICYRVVDSDGVTTLVQDSTSFEFVLDESTPANGKTPGIWHVVPTGMGEGRFCFWLKVKNGSAAKSYQLCMIRDEEGNTVPGKPITVVMGKSPFLSIPAYSQVRTTLTGENTDILFASNVTTRNSYAGNPTTFTAKLYAAEEKPDGSGYQKKNDAVLRTGSVTIGNDEQQVNSYTIPGGWLDSAGIYAVELSTSYLGGTTHGDISGVSGSVAEEVTLGPVTAYLIVKQAPAKVTLNELDSYYVTNDSIPAIGYSVIPSSANVEYTIQKSGEAAGARTPVSGGRIPFTQADLGTIDGLKTAYTVTVYARNTDAAASEPWSVDSMLLTVYNSDILDIIIADAAAGAIGGTTGGTGTVADGTTVNITNSGKLANYGVTDENFILSFSDFNTLRTDMSLQKIISANYGSGAWGMLSDKMEWASGDPDKVAVNYKQGGIYSDIRNYSYVTYGPETDFLLTGKGKTDAPVTITATHARTGMKAEFDVTTETLENKLYMFQFIPKTTTRVVYTNGSGAKCELESNDKGELAVYEPDGITGVVMAKAVYDGDTYVGTIYPEDLLSGERDIAALQLYPCNNLHLRAIADAKLTFKKPDGSDYSGSVT